MVSKDAEERYLEGKREARTECNESISLWLDQSDVDGGHDGKSHSECHEQGLSATKKELIAIEA